MTRPRKLFGQVLSSIHTGEKSPESSCRAVNLERGKNGGTPTGIPDNLGIKGGIMLQYFPRSIGRIFKEVRPGLKKIFYHDPLFKKTPETLKLVSPAFVNGEKMLIENTADGQKISPRLQWTGIPEKTKSYVLVIEDADSPTPDPLTHSITMIPGDVNHVARGALADYFAPDPPPGHGIHRYVFQLFALDAVLATGDKSSKRILKEAMRNRVLAKGMIIGTYERL